MSTAQADRYALGRTPEEYERLRLQARTWEAATGRLFDEVGLAPGASCLDAGCGPGETMRLMAERVGPAGRVWASTWTPRSAPWRSRRCTARATANARGAATTSPPTCRSPARRSTSSTRACCSSISRSGSPSWRGCGRPWPRAATSSCRTTTWAPSACSRHSPASRSSAGVLMGAFTAVGADVTPAHGCHGSSRRPGREPDGTDVAGRLEPLATGRVLLERVSAAFCRAHWPTASPASLTPQRPCGVRPRRRQFPDRPMLWPLMIGAWRRKDRA